MKFVFTVTLLAVCVFEAFCMHCTKGAPKCYFLAILILNIYWSFITATLCILQYKDACQHFCRKKIFGILKQKVAEMKCHKYLKIKMLQEFKVANCWKCGKSNCSISDYISC